MLDKPDYLKWIPPGRQPWQVGSAIIVAPDGESIISHVHGRPRRMAESRYFLLVNGKPFAEIVQVCPTCSGILQMGYAGRAEIDRWLADIRVAVQDDCTCEENYEAFLPIVAMFGRDVYWLGIVEYSLTSPDGRPSLSQFGKRRDPSGLAIGNGRFGPRYLEPMQPDSKIDSSFVHAYIDLIAKGKRPVGIAFYYDGFLSFLLDRHHKALAYSEHGLEMPCLTIRPMSQEGRDERKIQRWLEPGSYLGRPEKRRTVKPRELPRDFVAKARADGPARRSGEPQVVDEETEKRYLRLLGASR